jgi:hypothetical protein
MEGLAINQQYSNEDNILSELPLNKEIHINRGGNRIHYNHGCGSHYKTMTYATFKVAEEL